MFIFTSSKWFIRETSIKKWKSIDSTTSVSRKKSLFHLMSSGVDFCKNEVTLKEIGNFRFLFRKH